LLSDFAVFEVATDPLRIIATGLAISAMIYATSLIILYAGRMLTGRKEAD